jgi:hypothetical protein
MLQFGFVAGHGLAERQLFRRKVLHVVARQFPEFLQKDAQLLEFSVGDAERDEAP